LIWKLEINSGIRNKFSLSWEYKILIPLGEESRILEVNRIYDSNQDLLEFLSFTLQSDFVLRVFDPLKYKQVRLMQFFSNKPWRHQLNKL
jgi:hypothetical protein